MQMYWKICSVLSFVREGCRHKLNRAVLLGWMIDDRDCWSSRLTSMSTSAIFLCLGNVRISTTSSKTYNPPTVLTVLTSTKSTVHHLFIKLKFCFSQKVVVCGHCFSLRLLHVASVVTLFINTVFRG